MGSVFESLRRYSTKIAQIVPNSSVSESYDEHLGRVQGAGQELRHALEDVVTAASLPQGGAHFWGAVDRLGTAEAGYDLER